MPLLLKLTGAVSECSEETTKWLAVCVCLSFLVLFFKSRLRIKLQIECSPPTSPPPLFSFKPRAKSAAPVLPKISLSLSLCFIWLEDRDEGRDERRLFGRPPAQPDKSSRTRGWELIKRVGGINPVCMTQALKARPVHSGKWRPLKKQLVVSLVLVPSNFTLLNANPALIHEFSSGQMFWIVKTRQPTGGPELVMGIWVESAGWSND